MWPFKKKANDNKKKFNSIEEMITDIMLNTVGGELLDPDILILDDIELKLSVMNASDKEGFMHSNIVIEHKHLYEPIIESAVGLGSTTEDRAAFLAASFCTTTLCSLMSALRKEDPLKISARFYDRTNKFELYKSCMSVQGKVKGHDIKDYWELLGKDIEKRLGNKEAYYIKIYAAKTDTSTTCECRINNRVNKEITALLESYAKEWEVDGPIYSEKQCFTLMQDYSTLKSKRLNYDELRDVTVKAIKQYGDCNTSEKHNNLIENIMLTAQDINLGVELYTLIPETLCELVMDQVNYSSCITVFSQNKEIEMYKEQFTSYEVIRECLLELLATNQLSEAASRNILLCSANVNAINNALNNGSKAEDLVIASLGLNAFDEYTPF